MKPASFASITLKTATVHMVTYFIVGVLSFMFLDYAAKYADPAVANFVRQTDHPLVAAGPFFQILRGFLFGIAFFTLRESVFPHKRGWLALWLALVILGIFSPFGAAPSSIEGMIYTVLPVWFHIVNFPELFIQSGLLAFLAHYWVNRPEKRWLNWLLGIAAQPPLSFYCRCWARYPHSVFSHKQKGENENLPHSKNFMKLPEKIKEQCIAPAMRWPRYPTQ